MDLATATALNELKEHTRNRKEEWAIFLGAGATAALRYQMHAYVLMTNHLHLLLTPSDTTSLEKAVQLIKGASSHEIHKQRGGRMEIWQPGFHEATIRDAADYLSKLRYIEQNPVVAGLVVNPSDWVWGSASQRYNLDPIPQGRFASWASARNRRTQKARKPRPTSPVVIWRINVGAEAPTP